MPHIHEKIDFTVAVYIVYNDKVLLRKHDKYGMWLGVGGHIELGEDPTEAAVREVKEEVGLDVSLDDSLLPPTPPSSHSRDLIPPYYLGRHRINETHEHIDFIYFAKALTAELELSESEKSDEVKWFTRQDLENNEELLHDVKFYAVQALNRLSTKQ